MESRLGGYIAEYDGRELDCGCGHIGYDRVNKKEVEIGEQE